MAESQDPIASLRDRIAFFTEDIFAAVKSAFSSALQRKPEREVEPDAAQEAAIRMAEDAAAHLSAVAHDLKHNPKLVNPERLAKLDTIQQLSEEVIGIRG
jgi:hypothetical protein